MEGSLWFGRGSDHNLHYHMNHLYINNPVLINIYYPAEQKLFESVGDSWWFGRLLQICDK